MGGGLAGDEEHGHHSLRGGGTMDMMVEPCQSVSAGTREADRYFASYSSQGSIPRVGPTAGVDQAVLAMEEERCVRVMVGTACGE